MLKAWKSKARGFRRQEHGFTVGELAIVVMIVGLLAVVAPLELRPTNNITAMNSAVAQVGRVLKEAYSIAQQEKVPVTVRFYSNTNPDTNKQNSYEILRGGTEPMRPPIGVKNTKVNEAGVDHYYCKLLEGGPQPYFLSDANVYFRPLGAVTMCVDGTGNPTTGYISLMYDGVGYKNISVNEQGVVTP